MTKGKAEKGDWFLKGVRDGIPIALGYFAVAFALGIKAKEAGVLPAEGFLMSFLTHASAGEYAGLQVIAEKTGYLMMAVMTVVASARYFLMSMALSQRLDPNLGLRHRFLVAFGLTDEIFGAEIAQKGYVEPKYAYGLFVLPFLGWPAGTSFGILMGNLLPDIVVSALSVALYGMFLAIIVPPARKHPAILIGVLVSFALSFLASRLPGIRDLSSGIRIIILTVVVTAALALIRPVSDRELSGEEEEKNKKTEDRDHA